MSEYSTERVAELVAKAAKRSGMELNIEIRPGVIVVTPKAQAEAPEQTASTNESTNANGEQGTTAASE